MQKHEMTANVWKISVIGLSALAFWLSGCAMTVPGEESQFREPQLFDAHGRTWKLVEATRYDTRLWFFFITAGGDSQPKNLL